MRPILISLFSLFLIYQGLAPKPAEAREVTLFDRRGSPVAYLDTSDALTIYLWRGMPVAYLYADSIYGFNGRHLGWLRDGKVRDHKGRVAGFTKGAVNIVTQVEPVKPVKQVKPVKAVRQVPPVRPVFVLNTSPIALSLLLSAGR